MYISSVVCGAVLGCGLPEARQQPETASPRSALISPNDTHPFVHQAAANASAYATDEDRPVVMLVTHFDVLRVDVPLGSVSGSGKLWNHVREDLIAPELAAQLRRNGFRVGLAATSVWAPVRAILDSIAGATTSRQSLEIRNAFPLSVELDDGPHDQTIFLYRPDGTLVGASYSASRNRFRLEHSVSTDRLDQVALEWAPEVVEVTNRRQWKAAESGTGYELAPVLRSRVLHELAARLTVPPDHFLVVGPSDEVSRTALIGAAFLTHEVDGERLETLVFVTPKLFRTDAVGR